MIFEEYEGNKQIYDTFSETFYNSVFVFYFN